MVGGSRSLGLLSEGHILTQTAPSSLFSSSARGVSHSAHHDPLGLDLEEIDLNLFRSRTLWKPTGARAVFGGQGMVRLSTSFSQAMLMLMPHSHFLVVHVDAHVDVDVDVHVDVAGVD